MQGSVLRGGSLKQSTLHSPIDLIISPSLPITQMSVQTTKQSESPKFLFYLRNDCYTVSAARMIVKRVILHDGIWEEAERTNLSMLFLGLSVCSFSSLILSNVSTLLLLDLSLLSVLDLALSLMPVLRRCLSTCSVLAPGGCSCLELFLDGSIAVSAP